MNIYKNPAGVFGLAAALSAPISSFFLGDFAGHLLTPYSILAGALICLAGLLLIMFNKLPKLGRFCLLVSGILISMGFISIASELQRLTLCLLLGCGGIFWLFKTSYFDNRKI